LSFALRLYTITGFVVPRLDRGIQHSRASYLPKLLVRGPTYLSFALPFYTITGLVVPRLDRGIQHSRASYLPWLLGQGPTYLSFALPFYTITGFVVPRLDRGIHVLVFCNAVLHNFVMFAHFFSLSIPSGITHDPPTHSTLGSAR
jgi:hypothetical protein